MALVLPRPRAYALIKAPDAESLRRLTKHHHGADSLSHPVRSRDVSADSLSLPVRSHDVTVLTAQLVCMLFSIFLCGLS